MFILDSDHLVILQCSHEPFCSHLKARLARVVAASVYLTVVTVHEQFLGANNFISRAKDRHNVLRGYRMIESAMLSWNKYEVLPFDDPSTLKFERLRKQGVRIGTMDL